MFICLFVCLFLFMELIVVVNHCRTLRGSFPENFVKIRLDLAEILRISKLDWRDGGGEGEKKGRRRGGILLCNGLIILGHPQKIYPENFVRIRLDLAEILRI